MQNNKNKKSWLLPVIVVVLAVAALLCWKVFMPTPSADGKTIAVEIVHGDGSTKELDITSASENLRGALEQESLISGDESDYGLFVTTVDGETADTAAEQWWCFTKDGEMLMTGVDDTVIADGDHYEITLTEGYDF